MLEHLNRKSVTAFAAAAALVTVMAAPASAAVHQGTITDGTLTITQNSIDDIEFDISSPPDVEPCGPEWFSPTVDVDFPDTGTSGATTLNDLDSPSGYFWEDETDPNSDVYRMDLSLPPGGDNSGFVDSGSGTLDQNAGLLADIYNLGSDGDGGAGDCNNPVFAATFVVQLETEGTWDGADPWPPGTAVLDGGGTIVVISCGVGASALCSQVNGQQVIVDGLTIEF